MSKGFDGIRRRLEKGVEILGGGGVEAHDLVGDGVSLAEKFRAAQDIGETVIRVLGKFDRCSVAGDVFSEFALDAAKGLVLEMYTAGSSSDRQKAQNAVLDRALGKPVDRSINLTMDVNQASDEELNHVIGELLVELGFKGGASEVSTLLIEAEGAEGSGEVEAFSSESGVSGGVHTESCEDKVNNGGESGGEDARRELGACVLRDGGTSVQEG
jgi:hypothetical protein